MTGRTLDITEPQEPNSQLCIGLGIEAIIAAGIDHERILSGRAVFMFLLGLHETMLYWWRVVVKPVGDRVFDEADMLLCGSFKNQVIRLINLFCFDKKLLSRTTKAVVEKPEDSCSDSLIGSEFQDDKDLRTDLNLPEEEGAEDDTVLEELTEGIDVKCTKRKDWRKVRKNYERSKQYIFVAATLSVNGKQTAGGVLKRMLSEASWISGHYLHHHNPRCPLIS
ncbi:hypothetical protein RHMOL_Rhmol13G0007600 [Rhododendron molle]|uniref:Uncharacterized protein n=1 Tax=Rhododendron molle TaxID=49168 RepID=A0ACC0L335_RHOML|nr:hypothetical protein RHMOL_Rhmol13G0007600 [Rhododendron molle]